MPETISPSDRTREYLDLTRASDDAQNLQRLSDILRGKEKVMFIVGAGISVSAGIPAFRSEGGLFATTSGRNLFDASVYNNEENTALFHDMVGQMVSTIRAAKPTPCHKMLAKLAADGCLHRLYTQNIDGLDTKDESLATVIPLEKNGSWPRTIQLHGTLDKMVCAKCNDVKDMKVELFVGGKTPPCGECEKKDAARAECGRRSHGIGRLRPRIVLYNEDNQDQDAINAVIMEDLRSKPDALIVVGTSLKVPGVRSLVIDMAKKVRRQNGVTVWINNADRPPNGLGDWDLDLNASSDEVGTKFRPSEPILPRKKQTSKRSTPRASCRTRSAGCRTRSVTARKVVDEWKLYHGLYRKKVAVARKTSEIARRLPPLRCAR